MAADGVYDRICANCGLTYGSHRADDNRCPLHEGRMDWPAEDYTRFKDSGETRVVEYGTPSKELRL
jgi:hypothetical protein